MSRLVMVLLMAVLTAGCGLVPGLTEVALPGGPDLGDNPRELTVEFKDTLTLAPQATVKVDDVTVGTVAKIERIGWTARLTLQVRRDAEVPANAVAAIRQTGLLGEKFVELAPPDGEAPRGELADGATLTVSRTFRGVEVEEVLGALSLLLNGGGLARIKTITGELHAALDGREGSYRDLLRELDTFTSGLDRNRSALTSAIDGMDELTSNVRAGRRTIDRALTTIGPALKELADQRKQLVGMLRATGRFGDVATTTLNATRDDLVADLEALDPVLTQLATAGDALPQGLEFALTFPLPETADTIIHGDYANLDLELNISIGTVLGNLLGEPGPTGPVPPEVPLPDPLPGVPDLPDLPGLGGLPLTLSLLTPRSTP